jgi:hypothetical protein
MINAFEHATGTHAIQVRRVVRVDLQEGSRSGQSRIASVPVRGAVSGFECEDPLKLALKRVRVVGKSPELVLPAT